MAITIETPTGFRRPVIVLVGRPTFNGLLADVHVFGHSRAKSATFGERR
jgi:hypothetical protein